MSNRRKVPFNGQMVDATIVEFEPDKETFSTYLLEDGTTLKIKAVVTEVFRVDGLFQPNGDPVYGVSAAQVVSVNSPEALRRKDG
jgi:hypothetical protein